MTRRFTFRREAEKDIDRIFDWYEAKLPGLGAAFLEEMDLALGRILNRPLSYQIKYKNARRATIQRFPYEITFVVRDDNIVIVACTHGRRDPRAWQARL